MERRKFLAVTAGAGSMSLSGCLDFFGDNGIETVEPSELYGDYPRYTSLIPESQQTYSFLQAEIEPMFQLDEFNINFQEDDIEELDDRLLRTILSTPIGLVFIVGPQLDLLGLNPLLSRESNIFETELRSMMNVTVDRALEVNILQGNIRSNEIRNHLTADEDNELEIEEVGQISDFSVFEPSQQTDTQGAGISFNDEYIILGGLAVMQQLEPVIESTGTIQRDNSESQHIMRGIGQDSSFTIGGTWGEQSQGQPVEDVLTELSTVPVEVGYGGSPNISDNSFTGKTAIYFNDTITEDDNEEIQESFGIDATNRRISIDDNKYLMEATYEDFDESF